MAEIVQSAAALVMVIGILMVCLASQWSGQNQQRRNVQRRTQQKSYWPEMLYTLNLPTHGPETDMERRSQHEHTETPAP